MFKVNQYPFHGHNGSSCGWIKLISWVWAQINPQSISMSWSHWVKLWMKQFNLEGMSSNQSYIFHKFLSVHAHPFLTNQSSIPYNVKGKKRSVVMVWTHGSVCVIMNIAPSMDISYSSSLNGSDPEQMSERQRMKTFLECCRHLEYCFDHEPKYPKTYQTYKNIKATRKSSTYPC